VWFFFVNIIFLVFIFSGPRFVCQIGDKTIDYNEEFRLFMTTRNPNPEIPPDAAAIITEVNFTTTRAGLTGQARLLYIPPFPSPSSTPFSLLSLHLLPIRLTLFEKFAGCGVVIRYNVSHLFFIHACFLCYGFTALGFYSFAMVF
jgi:hypothetical protein